MKATAASSTERQLAAGIAASSPWAAVLEQAGVAVAVLDADFAFLHVSEGYAHSIGKSPAFFPGRNYFDVFPHAASEAVFRQVRDSRIAQAGTAVPGHPQPGHGGELERWNWSLTAFAGRARSSATRYLVLTIQHPAAQRAAGFGACGDDTGHLAGEWRLRRLFESLTSGFALHEIVLDAAGKPCDYRFLEANTAFEAITGLERSRIIGRCASAVLGQLDSRWLQRYAAVALNGDCGQFDDYRSDLNRHYRLTAYCPDYGQVAVIYDDVTTFARPNPDAPSRQEPREDSR
ncbi:MAG: hypothetical protein FAZ92_02196 [Accumulibacter sp.]|uniref:PAS domain-containing protein n=1 Tax=Accumulibacter sp. TaxID=2053492 RepID=UPI001209F5B4|nr:PAS domain-containing protein [Accumulibacter sp.]TLD45525.1 MAG: hypothetical protein FAZ92_02196 [Accumulibacter sp.]